MRATIERLRSGASVTLGNESIAETSTDQAPWYVVPADRKWYRNWVVLNVLLATLEQMDPQFPPEEPGLDDLVIR